MSMTVGIVCGAAFGIHTGGTLVWEWLDWVNAATAVPLAVGGFGLAIQQVRKAKVAADNAATAAQAAEDAAKTATTTMREQFQAITVSSLLPQLVRLEEAVDIAIRIKSPELLAHVISNWKWQAGMCRAYLDENNTSHKPVMTDIQKSIVATRNLKFEMPNFTATTDWVDATGKLRKAMGEVTSSFGEIAAQQSIKEPG